MQLTKAKSILQHDFVYIKLPNKISDLNYWMCGHWNREGINCGKCRSGYWPLAYSYNLTCVLCHDGKYNWIYLMLLLFVPSTAFYVLVLFFKLNVASSHLHGFVFFSQIISTPIITRILVSSSQKYYLVKITSKVLGTFFGIWNLDFFRLVIPDVCLKVSSFEILVLEYIAGIYPIALIILSYILVGIKLNQLFAWQNH